MRGVTPGNSYTWKEFCPGEFTHWEELCNGRSYIWKDFQTFHFLTTSHQGQAIGRVTLGKSYDWKWLHNEKSGRLQMLHTRKIYILKRVTYWEELQTWTWEELHPRRIYILEVLGTGKSYVLERFIPWERLYNEEPTSYRKR